MAPPHQRTVALVGRPNVGKSRLFNRLARRRVAIVHDQAGVTRDVNAIEIEQRYTLLDTGGIGLVVDMDHQKLIGAAEDQVWFAVEAAQVICLVVDGREGLQPLDETIAAKLRTSGKKILLIVNKADTPEVEDRAVEFASLGFDHYVCVSAEHGRNEDELRTKIDTALDSVIPLDPPVDDTAAPTRRIPLAFVGRPNVGKSSIVNRLLASDRLVVSEVPGTTRDSVSLDFDFTAKDGEKWPFRLVDTAGLRHRGKVSHSVEYFSSVRSHDAIAEAEIVYLVIDAEEGVTRTDKALAGEIVEAGKCLVIVVNKWDVALERFQREPVQQYESIDAFREAYTKDLLHELFFLPDSPVIFISAKTGYSFDRVLRAARMLWQTSNRRIATPRLNTLLERLIEKRSPRIIKGRRFKIYYATQTGNRPFAFRLFCNRATKLEDSYRRYLEKAVIEEFKLTGCPIRFELRGKTVRYARTPQGRSTLDPKAPKPKPGTLKGGKNRSKSTKGRRGSGRSR
jgi:GTP-binding protein